MPTACWWFIVSSSLLFRLQLSSQFLSKIPVSRSSSPYPSWTLLPWTMPEMAGLCLTLTAAWLPGSALALSQLELRAPSTALPCRATAGQPFLAPALLPWPCLAPALQEQLAPAVPWGGTREPSLQLSTAFSYKRLELCSPTLHLNFLWDLPPGTAFGLLWWCVCPQGQLDLFQALLGSLVTSSPKSLLQCPFPQLLQLAPFLQRAHGYSAAMALLHSKALHLTPDRRNGDEYTKEGRMLSGFWASAKLNVSEQPKPKLGFCALLPGRNPRDTALCLCPCALQLFGLTCCDIDWGSGFLVEAGCDSRPCPAPLLGSLDGSPALLGGTDPCTLGSSQPLLIPERLKSPSSLLFGWLLYCFECDQFR